MDFGEQAIHKIYEAANEAEYWSEAARAVVDTTGGGAVHLLLASLETGHEYINLFTRDEVGFAAEYIRDYAAIDFRVPRVMARPLGAFADEREYVSDDDARASPIHQELLPRYDVHNISGANLCLDGCIGWFGISTSDSSVEFDDRQRAYLGRLSRHLLNACRISRTHQDLEIARDRSLSTLDLVDAGLFLMKSERIVHANEAATRLVAERFFSIQNDRLCCASVAGNKKLGAFLKQAAVGPEQETLLLRHEDQAAVYLVSVHELFPRYGGDRIQRSGYQAISIVELNLPAQIDLDDVMSFCSAYGVTPAEAMAVHASLNSVSLASLAESRRIGLGTAQQQLKSALAKMDLNSQKKLFRAFERYRIVGRHAAGKGGPAS